MKKQIVLIHGGDTFDTYEEYIEFLKEYELDDPSKNNQKRWKHTFEEKLGSDFNVIAPLMPSKYNAKYKEWKIWFEKLFPYLEDNVVLIGHSLGGTFLAKYLSENNFPKNILATYLIAAPYDDKDSDYSLSDFALSNNLEEFEKQGGKIFLYHSKDDPMVPFTDIEKYAKALPSAEKVIFENREHFLQEEFPELIESVQHLY